MEWGLTRLQPWMETLQTLAWGPSRHGCSNEAGGQRPGRRHAAARFLGGYSSSRKRTPWWVQRQKQQLDGRMDATMEGLPSPLVSFYFDSPPDVHVICFVATILLVSHSDSVLLFFSMNVLISPSLSTGMGW
ncbi:hypothetical protein VPH35_129348 [Triticum aestivum]